MRECRTGMPLGEVLRIEGWIPLGCQTCSPYLLTSVRLRQFFTHGRSAPSPIELVIWLVGSFASRMADVRFRPEADTLCSPKAGWNSTDRTIDIRRIDISNASDHGPGEDARLPSSISIRDARYRRGAMESISMYSLRAW